MLRSLICTLFLVGCGAFALAEPPAIYNNVPAARLEKVLERMDIKYKKVPGKKEGVDFYDVQRGDKLLRLHNYQGQDLWLDCVFTEKLSLDDINRWNTRARASRAVLLKRDDQVAVSLESQLDCLGGVTDDLIRQFVTRFEGEVQAFEKFVSK